MTTKNSNDLGQRVQQLSQESIRPFPSSRRVYFEGSTPDIQVGMRAIDLSDTVVGGSKDNPETRPNESVYVYDTSGPYTDPNADIDVRRGLEPLRQQWIDKRGDTELLTDASARYTKERAANPALEALRFHSERAPRRAKAGHNVTQMHYARQGIITPEMEWWTPAPERGRSVPDS